MPRIEQEAILRDSERIQAEEDEVTARLRALNEAIEQRVMDEVAALSEGTEQGPRTLARQVEKRRQQQVPFPWLPVLGYLAIAFLLLAETFQLTGPFLDFLGFDPANIAFEFARAPVSVAGGIALAISATAGLMFLWHVLMRNAVEIATGWETAGPLRSGAKLVGLFFLCVFLFIFTLAIAYLRHSTTSDATLGQNTVSHTGTSVFVCLTILMPAAAAYLQKKIAESSYWQLRADLKAEHARQDQAEDQLHQPRNKRADIVEILESKRAQLAKAQERLDARRQALEERILSAQREWRERLKNEQQATKTYLNTLVSALETDRCYFLRFARRYKAMHLVPDEPSCLPPGSISATVTEGHDAFSGDELTPHYRVVRRLLIDGRRSELDS